MTAGAGAALFAANDGNVVLVHLDDGVRPRAQYVPVGFGNAEQFGDDLDGQRFGVQRNEIDRRSICAGVGEVVGETVGQNLDAGAQAFDVSAGEGAG